MSVFGRRAARWAAGAATGVAPWGRQRLLLMLSGALVLVLALVIGVGLAVWYTVGGSLRTTPAATALVPANGLSLRDRIAAEPMAGVDPQAAYTPDSTIQDTPTMLVPLPADDDLGLAEVAVGFPHTPAGAVAQWAAIERRVLEAMDLQVARKVHQEWVLPGGPALAQWELTRSVQAFLTSARQSGQRKDVSTLVAATPAGAIVKGADGPDWVLACVLLDVRVVVKAEARMGYGLCARMLWVGDRWLVGAGAQPAVAPSTWPGSATAARAGWLAWVDGEGGR